MQAKNSLRGMRRIYIVGENFILQLILQKGYDGKFKSIKCMWSCQKGVMGLKD